MGPSSTAILVEPLGLEPLRMVLPKLAPCVHLSLWPPTYRLHIYLAFALIVQKCNCSPHQLKQELADDAGSRDLHWPLPVRQRNSHKTPPLVHKCHVMAYIATYAQSTSHSARRSRYLSVPGTRTNYGDRGFPIDGPAMRSSLPLVALRTRDTWLNISTSKDSNCFSDG